MAATAQLADLVLLRAEDHVYNWQPLLAARGLQVITPLRFKNAEQVDRGGVLVGYSFIVQRRHASYAAAGEYLDDLPRAVGRAFGTFTAQRGLGGPAIQLEKAAVTSFAAQPHKGILTTVAFTVTGSLPADVT
jgi:hypothetical protein